MQKGVIFFAKKRGQKMKKTLVMMIFALLFFRGCTGVSGDESVSQSLYFRSDEALEGRGTVVAFGLRLVDSHINIYLANTGKEEAKILVERGTDFKDSKLEPYYRMTIPAHGRRQLTLRASERVYNPQTGTMYRLRVTSRGNSELHFKAYIYSYDNIIYDLQLPDGTIAARRAHAVG